ncbi:hypothetical protein K493DRAFT_354533 [Basidiobolus meristosporus CBS 931.73]|uniref:Uncharacterized protein n=1 Tax=Basidiobolus meristosporus CBS 931.73 TaxID=1314790 RepID=A0A1Y1Y2Z3_9FUNG|nr:hypothetical protein K493DRAFT_354533 [Basidiobolus meristosporus CBS 931.73]|eukprot:ORX92391.1 hypothetical protein K493DRAFT_354533 [Basidiobolus meristosporus CBS 931.73]
MPIGSKHIIAPQCGDQEDPVVYEVADNGLRVVSFANYMDALQYGDTMKRQTLALYKNKLVGVKFGQLNETGACSPVLHEYDGYGSSVDRISDVSLINGVRLEGNTAEGTPSSELSGELGFSEIKVKCQSCERIQEASFISKCETATDLNEMCARTNWENGNLHVNLKGCPCGNESDWKQVVLCSPGFWNVATSAERLRAKTKGVKNAVSAVLGTITKQRSIETTCDIDQMVNEAIRSHVGCCITLGGSHVPKPKGIHPTITYPTKLRAIPSHKAAILRSMVSKYTKSAVGHEYLFANDSADQGDLAINISLGFGASLRHSWADPNEVGWLHLLGEAAGQLDTLMRLQDDDMEQCAKSVALWANVSIKTGCLGPLELRTRVRGSLCYDSYLERYRLKEPEYDDTVLTLEDASGIAGMVENQVLGRYYESIHLNMGDVFEAGLCSGCRWASHVVAFAALIYHDGADLINDVGGRERQNIIRLCADSKASTLLGLGAYAEWVLRAALTEQLTDCSTCGIRIAAIARTAYGWYYSVERYRMWECSSQTGIRTYTTDEIQCGLDIVKGLGVLTGYAMENVANRLASFDHKKCASSHCCQCGLQCSANVSNDPSTVLEDLLAGQDGCCVACHALTGVVERASHANVAYSTVAYAVENTGCRVECVRDN